MANYFVLNLNAKHRILKEINIKSYRTFYKLKNIVDSMKLN